MAIITVSNTGGNWNATTSWVGGVLPLSTDTIAFTATSGSLTVNVASICAGFDMTNYSAGKTITFTSTLTINGPWNLGSGAYTQAGASGIIMPVSATITSNGVTWSRTLTLQGTSQTFTLSGNDLTVSGLLTLSPVTTMAFVGAFNINVLGGLTISGTTAAVISGASTPIIIKGGTWNHTVASYIQNAITINPSTTVTLGAAQCVSSPTLTYTAGVGSVTTGTGTLSLNSNITLATNGMTWYSISITSAIATTLSNDLHYSGTLTTNMGSNGGCSFSGSTIYGGGVNFAGQFHYITGLSGCTLVLNTSGTLNGYVGAVTGFGFQLPVTINHSGTTTINKCYMGIGSSLTLVSGSVVMGSPGLLAFNASSGSVTVTGFSGVTFTNVYFQTGATFIFDFTNVSGTVTTFGNFTVQDSSGLTIGTLQSSTVGTMTLQSGHTYTIKTAFSYNTATAAGLCAIKTSTPGTKAIINLVSPASQDIGFTNFTDIDASGGKRICTYKSTLSNTINIINLPTDFQTIVY